MKKFTSLIAALIFALSLSMPAQSATLAELDGLTGNPGWDALVGKIRSALLIKAHALTELTSPTAAQLAYARLVIKNPGAQAREVVFYVVAANENTSVTAILNALDSTIKTNVNNAVDDLFTK